jgi:UV DNA damage endonuclease
MIHWNEEKGIRFLRMSSDMFPHKSNSAAPSYDFEFVRPLLEEAGQLARSLNHRLTFHPGQYNVVGTTSEEIFQRTVAELDWHAEVLDIMGCDKDSIMVVHGGGVYGDKAATIRRWAENYKRLPERVQRRLVVENCEKCYSVKDCLEISRLTNIPVVFDLHHHACYRQLHPDEDIEEPEAYLPAVLETWLRRGMRPKFHISEQRYGCVVGKHSDYISEIPTCLLKLKGIDIAVEAKMKEQAIFRLYDRHPEIAPPCYQPKPKKRLVIVKRREPLKQPEASQTA